MWKWKRSHVRVAQLITAYFHVASIHWPVEILWHCRSKCQETAFKWMGGPNWTVSMPCWLHSIPNYFPIQKEKSTKGESTLKTSKNSLWTASRFPPEYRTKGTRGVSTSSWKDSFPSTSCKGCAAHFRSIGTQVDAPVILRQRQHLRKRVLSCVEHCWTIEWCLTAKKEDPKPTQEDHQILSNFSIPNDFIEKNGLYQLTRTGIVPQKLV